MSEYRDGIKLKTTTPSVILLKLLRKWYPNQSLSDLRAMVQNHEYIYLTDQEKSWIEGDRKMAKLLKELDRAGFETELYRERQEKPGCPWQADPMDREFFRNTLQTDREIERETMLDIEREVEGFVSPEAMADIEEELRNQDEEY
ncbi:hypothetical protein [Lawsonibacter sp. JLR.KK007]|jgi:hypothetical protein|uniref:hypothetical protein n=1 Tax=Lawsonibacter sp. JLR.KK007 TaxID=3114293 RepID=UPI002FEEF9DA